MNNQTTYEYVPGFLARRFPSIAALEDNPIYLRESGKRYGSGWRRASLGIKNSIGTVFGAIKTIIYVFVTLLVVTIILAAIQVMGCIMVLAVPLGYFALSGVFRTSGSLSYRLEKDWQMGRLQPLYVTSLTGRDIFWGYAGAGILRSVKIGAVLLVLLMLSVPGYCILNSGNSWHIQWKFLPPIETGILALGLQILLSLILSTIMYTADELQKIAAPVGKRMQTGITSGAESVGIMLITVLPGVIAAAVLTTASAFAIPAMMPSMISDEWMISIHTTLFFLIYGAVNLPITALFTATTIRNKLRLVDQEFSAGIQRLMEREGEKSIQSNLGN